MENFSMQVQWKCGRKGGGGRFLQCHKTDTAPLRKLYESFTPSEMFHTKNTETFCCWSGIVLSWFRFCAGFSAWLQVIQTSHMTCGVLAPGHLVLYCSSVSTTKTTVGPEPRPRVARSHTGMTTSSAVIQVLGKTNFHVNCWVVVQGVLHFTRCEGCFCIPDSCAASWGQYFTGKVFLCVLCLDLSEPQPVTNQVTNLLCHFSNLTKSISSIPAFLKPTFFFFNEG